MSGKLGEKVALPLTTGAVPSVLAPSENVTVPPGLAPVMLAVSGTGWFWLARLSGLLRAVLVASRLTVRTAAADVLAPLVVSPQYSAVKLWLPTMLNVPERLACPLAAVAWPSTVPPWRKTTLPLGLVPLIVAVRVAVSPAWMLAGEMARLVVVGEVAVIVSLTFAEVLPVWLLSPL